MIAVGPTERGGLKGVFLDRFGERCSIQESSFADEDCIWLGCEHETVDKCGQPCGARMHLSRGLAEELIPLLQEFVETGNLRNWSPVAASQLEG